MKSSAIVFCFLLMASLFVRAQSPDEEIARAVMASPAAMVADAMVIRFSDDGRRRRTGRRLSCFLVGPVCMRHARAATPCGASAPGPWRCAPLKLMTHDDDDPFKL